ncbi:MAG: peptidase M50 [Phreatobacter sp.]|uniref:peptidase M50 n=1 Tax=Phreatobacter sp. TaxID=1966341 RepID=UPI004035B2DC
MTQPFLSSSWHRVADLKPKLRADLSVEAHDYHDTVWYVVRDPATNRVHRFSAPAYAIVGALDGRTTLDDAWRRAAEQLGDAAPGQDEALRVLAHLHQQDLLQAGIAPATRELLDRLTRQRRQRRQRFYRNPIAITLPLFSPDRQLARLDRATRGLGLKTVALVWLAVVVPGLFALALHWDGLTGAVADQALTAQNLALLAIVFPFAKLLHELAHGWTAKRFGGSVTECGVMLLVFYPVPYVDTSSVQGFPDKRQRALVSAAGMAADLFMGAAALLVWAAAEPGLTRAIAFNFALVAGFSTLFVNGNPLLRFDGYFVLCDLAETPNLASRANRWWGTLAERRLFGARTVQPDPATGAERLLLACYAPLSYVYRVALLLAVGLYLASEWWFVGVAAALWAVVIGLVVPIGKLVKHVVSAPSLAERRGRAVGVSLAAVTGAVALLAAAPAPHHVIAEGVVWLPEDAVVRAGASGFVEALLARPGERVTRGQPLARLAEPFLVAEREVAARKLAEVDARLEIERFGDQSRLEILQRERDAAVGDLARLDQRLSRLLARARADGRFEAPLAADLPGRFLAEGATLGHVLPDTAPRLKAILSQDDVDLVRSRTRSVVARFPGRAEAIFEARVERQIPAGLDRLPSPSLGPLGGGGALVDPRDPDGLRALQRYFEVDLALTAPPAEALFGARALVRFDLEWEPLGVQGWRRLRQLFLSRLQT